MNKFCPKFLLVFALLLSCSFTLARAQELSKTFIISPPSVTFELQPGEETERPIKVTNQSSLPMDFVVDVKDFVVTDTQGTPELLAPGTLTNNKFAASTWATAQPDSFTVEPGKSVTTTLYLRVPADARPGGRYFSVTFRPVATDNLASSGAAVNTIIGSLVYLTVAGPTTETANITKFFTPKLSEYGPVTIATEITNSGDIHLNPKATIEIKNIFGKKVFGDALRSVNIFPGTARTYENNWNKKWLFGRYSANLAGYYGSKNLPLMASTIFWIIPYRLILAVVLAVIIIGLISVIARNKPPQTPPATEEKTS